MSAKPNSRSTKICVGTDRSPSADSVDSPPVEGDVSRTHTNLVEFYHDKSPELRSTVSSGSLSPCCRTSLMWPDRWPLKPDVVAEGENGCMIYSDSAKRNW